MFRRIAATLILSTVVTAPALAQKSEPANVYLFPAGAQRGTTVEALVEGENVTGKCDFHLTPGHGVTAAKEAVGKRIKLTVSPDASPGVAMWRIATAQGGTGSRAFAIGEYPEVTEPESASEEAAPVKLPVTINGRINPDGDVDRYSVELKAGQPFSAEVTAARLGGPLDTNCFVGQFGNPPSDVAYMQLDSSLELYGPDGRLLSQAEDTFGLDPALGFIAPQGGRYTVLVRHMAMAGIPQFVYRLTLAEKPLVQAVYPAGGRLGSTLSAALYGQGLKPETRQEVSVALNARAAGVPLQVSELSENLETEPNDAAASAQVVSLPAVMNGRFQRAGDSDFYKVTLRKGETWRFEAFLRRLGAPTDAALSVLDAVGRAMASAEAPPNGDAELVFSAPADGVYLVQIREIAMSRMGDRLVYRLVAAPQQPDFRVQLSAEFLDLEPGGSGELEVAVRRLGGFAGPIKITVDGLPEGVAAAPLEMPGNQDKAKLKLTSAKGGRSGSWTLRVTGSGELGGQSAQRIATAPVANPAESGLGSAPRTVEDVLVTVRFPAPFKFDADDSYLFLNLGSVHQARVFIERNPGFTNPIRLSVADRLPRNPYGIHFMPTIVTDLGKEAFIPMILPQGPRGNEISRTHVKAEAVVKDADGREWHVLQTAKKNTVCRCLAPLLSLAVQPDALRAKRDSTARIRFSLGRTAVSAGAAEIHLMPSTEIKGVSMEPISVVAGESVVNGTLKIAPDAALGKATELWFEVVSKRDTGQTIFYQAKLVFDLRP